MPKVNQLATVSFSYKSESIKKKSESIRSCISSAKIYPLGELTESKVFQRAMELYGTGSRRHDTGKQTIMELTSVGGDHVEIKYTSVIEIKYTSVIEIKYTSVIEVKNY